MITSLQQLFSNEQAVTTTDVSDNVIDLGAPETVLNGPYPLNRDIGNGNPIPLLVQVTENFATLTSLTISIQVSDAEDFGVYRTVYTTAAIPRAELIAGFKLPLHFVPLTVDLRYVRLNYAVTGSTATAGKITAGIVGAVQTGGLAGGLAA